MGRNSATLTSLEGRIPAAYFRALYYAVPSVVVSGKRTSFVNGQRPRILVATFHQVWAFCCWSRVSGS
jgi:hypothetical protein